MNRKTNILLWLLTSLLLMTVAFYNGFPLAEGDTGSYIETGLRGILPRDRTPFYGYFLGLSSFHVSLWFTIFFQSALLSFLLLRYFVHLRKGVYRWNSTLALVLIVLSFTCVSWVSSYLMPDVFGGILLLSVLLFLTLRGQRPGELILYLFIIFTATIIHNSHFLILFLFSISLLLWAVLKRNKIILKRSLPLLVISVSSWVTICSINQANGFGFVFSRAGHVFMVTKFAETGILNSYLHDNCGKKPLKMCAYIDKIPYYSWDFLWDNNSPLYKTGGWDANKQEFDMITHDVFTTPKYIKMFVQKAATGTLRQFFDVRIPQKYTDQGGYASSHVMIQRYLPDAAKEFESSRQNTNGLFGAGINFVCYLFFIFTSVVVIFHSKKIEPELLVIYNLIFVFLFFNAFVTSTFSTVHYRFQNRIFWILPATNAIFILNLFFKSAWDKKSNSEK